MLSQNSSITELKGIGDKSAKLFHKLGIFYLSDLLSYYPRDYEIFEPRKKIANCKPGEMVALRAMVTSSPTLKQVRNLSILTFMVSDETGQISMTYFNMSYLKNSIKKGGYYTFRGLLQQKNNRMVIEQAKIYKEEEFDRLVGKIMPRYPLTKGITNHSITKAVTQTLEHLSMDDPLPLSIRNEYKLMDYQTAVSTIHFPPDWNALVTARGRLAFDELFYFILMIRKNKEHNEKLICENPFIETADTSRLLEALPYQLTAAQLRVWEEIKQDMTSGHVMNRLVQGDVGSGKTILAFLALLMAVSNGAQGALMAPTEVLATQHFENVRELIQKYHLPFRPVLLTGSVGVKQKKEIYHEIECGDVNLVIGTHALIQEKVSYKNLALVITDEQHRFGVRQRENLFSKGNHPHVLVMSATPIPRTLAMILYGDLDISVVDELPSNRRPIKNCVVNQTYRSKAYQFISKEVSLGHQVYCICPMVEAGDDDTLENVIDYTEKLRNELPPQIQVTYLHGKMRAGDKNQIMDQFAKHQIDVLVSTTVIEVGINVPNATVMLIENAERFGLAQLHQLRGRVGRGDAQSFCIFISGNDKQETMNRLDILNKSNDGFAIANADLKMRGPGDLFGIRQSGILNFKIADIYQDALLLNDVNECVDRLLTEDALLLAPEHEKLKHYLTAALERAVDLSVL